VENFSLRLILKTESGAPCQGELHRFLANLTKQSGSGHQIPHHLLFLRV